MKRFLLVGVCALVTAVILRAEFIHYNMLGFVHDSATFSTFPLPAPGDNGPEWHLAASADFNGDGKADLVWQNVTTGEVQVWIMDGFAQTAIGTWTIDPAWRIVGAGDMDGDGRKEIIWYNQAALSVIQWHMNGAQIVSAALMFDDHQTDFARCYCWTIVGVADLNGDGKDDLIWHVTDESLKGFGPERP